MTMHRSYRKHRPLELASASLSIALVLQAGTMAHASPTLAKPAPSPTSIPAVPVRPTAEIVEQFVQYVADSSDYAESARRFVAAEWDKRRGTPVADTLLSESLALLYPDFKTALDGLSGDNAKPSLETLIKLADHRDPYLSVNAATLAAQALVDQDRIIEADALLRRVSEQHADWRDRTTAVPELLFLQGFCALQALRYDDAISSFSEFVRGYPAAPERLRRSAEQILTELSRREPQRLGDVRDLMDYARRELSLGKSDGDVREKQRKAVDLLNALIAEAEEREKQQNQGKSSSKSGSKKGTPRGANPGNQHAQRSMLPPGEANGPGELGEAKRVRPGEAWGKMQPNEREALLQALQKQFPSQYRDLVEQYYRQLSKDGSEP